VPDALNAEGGAQLALTVVRTTDPRPDCLAILHVAPGSEGVLQEGVLHLVTAIGMYLSDNVADLPAAADVRDLFRRVWL